MSNSIETIIVEDGSEINTIEVGIPGLQGASGTGGSGTIANPLTEELQAADQVIGRPELKDYSETISTVSSSSGSLTLDIENGNVFDVTLTENITTLTINNPPVSGKACYITLILKQDATGGRTVTFPASVNWSGGTAPTLSTDPNAVDVLKLLTTDGGTSWYGNAFFLSN